MPLSAQGTGKTVSFFHLTGEEATAHKDSISHYQGPKRRLEPKVPVGWLTRPLVWNPV